jgi:HemY protein
MVRLVVAFVVIAALAAAAAWLADYPDVALQWGGFEARVDTAALLGAFVVFIVALIALDRLWRWFRRGPRWLGAARAERRQRQGYVALTQGMAAVAAGDAEQAARLARKAESLLEEPPLTLLLSAQAAQLNGDSEAAGDAFSAMLEKPETEFLGLRGLIVQALRQGDTATALKHAKRAYKLRPNTPWVVRSLFALQTGAGDWTGARATLAHGAKQGLVAAADAKRQTGLLLLADARKFQAKGDSGQARVLAVKAHEAVPDFAPAADLAARLLHADGKTRRAVKLLKETWAKAPHPVLVEAFSALEPDETPEQRLKRFTGLREQNPDHAETRFADASLAIKAGEWDLARDELKHLIDGGDADNRVYTLMADVEKRQHGDSASAREWLFKAANAPHPQAWSCRACGHEAGDWQPRCPACETFDGLTWGAPERQAKALPALESLALAGDLDTLPPPGTGQGAD